MSETAKLLTVIVPSYNMEAYLPKCLGSLVGEGDAQEVGSRNYELGIKDGNSVIPNSSFSLLNSLDVIVVNDGSTDRTSEIAHDFERRYPGLFRVIDKPNGHYGSCINAALPMAKGKYVKVLDADDTFDTIAFGRYLRELSSLAESGDEPELILTDYDKVDLAGCARENIRYSIDPFRTLDFEAVAGELLGRRLAMHALTYSLALFDRFSYKQEEGVCYTDSQWMFIPLGYVHKVRKVSCVLYKYLVGRDEQSVDDRVLMDKFDQMILVWTKNLQWYGANRDALQNAKFLSAHLKHQFGWIYHVVLFQMPFGRVNPLLSQFDRVYQDVFGSDDEMTRTFSILKNSVHPIRFLSCLRNHRCLGLALLFIVRGYAHIRNFRGRAEIEI